MPPFAAYVSHAYTALSGLCLLTVLIIALTIPNVQYIIRTHPFYQRYPFRGFYAGFITHSPVIHKVQFMNRFYLHKNNSTLTGFFSECAKNLERLKIKKIGIKIGNDEELSMELLQLEYFYAVAKTQHVTHTAEQLHIAQPALTQSIHRLEKELGVPLFHRNGRNIALTEYGVYLRDALKPILENLHELPEVLQEMANVRKRTIRVNVLAASTLVTHALISYQKSHSGLNFRLIQNSQCEDADITIFTRSFFQQPADGQGRYQIFTERIFMAVPQDSPYARCESVRLKDFAHQNFISLSGSRSIRSICDRYCQHAGFTPNIIFESDSPDTVKNLIAGGLGVGFWPHYTWGQENMEQIVLLPISEPTCQRDLVVHLHRHAVEHVEAVDFFQFLSRYLLELKGQKRK